MCSLTLQVNASVGRSTWYPSPSTSLTHPSVEKHAHRDKQAGEREEDKHHLVNMILAGWQIAQQVRAPENGVKPKAEPGPAFAAPVWDHRDQDAKYPHPNVCHANGAIIEGIRRAREHRSNQPEEENRRANDRQRNPRGFKKGAFRFHHDDTIASSPKYLNRVESCTASSTGSKGLYHVKTANVRINHSVG